MASNPNPTRISAPMWRFWEEFSAFEDDAELGGIYADKTGYHNYRDALSSTDYSVEEVANDRKGSGKYADGIDLTLNESNMKKYSNRLKTAYKSKDKRLFINGEPATREFIGTIDGDTVYCYMLTGGIPQGVGSDSGEDWGRDSSHLWHIHISIIRKFGDNWQIFSGLLSILKGEPYDDWEYAMPTVKEIWDYTQDNPYTPEAEKTSMSGFLRYAPSLNKIEERLKPHFEDTDVKVNELSVKVDALTTAVAELTALVEGHVSGLIESETNGR